MNKAALIDKMQEKTGLSRDTLDKALNAFIETVGESLAEGEKVQIVGFGTFEAKERAERALTSPATGEKITVAAHKVPSFKAGKGLKEKF